jgi:transketolase
MRALLTASLTDPNPWYVRFGKGGEPIFSSSVQKDPSGPKIFGDPTPEILFVTTGIIIHEVLAAVEHLSNSESYKVAAIHLPELTRIELNRWKDMFLSAERVIVAEEHIPLGGLFSRILHSAHKHKLDTRKLLQVCLPFSYPHNYGSQKDHLRICNLDALGLIELARLP